MRVHLGHRRHLILERRNHTSSFGLSESDSFQALSENFDIFFYAIYSPLSLLKMIHYINDTRSADPSKSSRQLEVIGAGLPRCATSSLQAALESPQLGFAPCMHMAHIAPFVDQLNLVLATLREEDRERRQKTLHKIFDGYAATADFPGVAFIEDLMDMYPDAQIILNGRKPGQEWADSIQNSLAFFASASYLYICFLNDDRSSTISGTS
jgi:hypothetical protein